jgi:hypothetical protein
MSNQSLATIQPQPDYPFYSEDLLQLFPTFTRATYQQFYGVQAPNFDATQPAKYWQDDAAAGVPASQAVTYNEYVQAPGSAIPENPPATIQQFQIAAGVAATVNIPGDETYPLYTPSPTPATYGGALINPQVFSTQAQGLAIVAALGLPSSALIDATWTAAGPDAYSANGETRRMWAIVLPNDPTGRAWYVGDLLALEYANGIGYPGSWSIVDGTVPAIVWTPAVLGPDGISSGIPTASVPVPVRPLFPNEEFVIAGIGAVMIRRTDM